MAKDSHQLPIPTWLESFQWEMSEAINHGLDFKTGSALATPESYSIPLLAEIPHGPKIKNSERLAVYQRQYWFRFFGVMQQDFPLLSRLIGLWEFNQIAQSFLRQHRPNHWSIQHLGDGFSDWIAGLSTHQLSAFWELRPQIKIPHTSGFRHITAQDLAQAAHIDWAWTQAFLAPEIPAWQPRPEELAELQNSSLAVSSGLWICQEDYEHFATREALLQGSHPQSKQEGPIPWPAKHEQTQFFALFRVPQSNAVYKLTLHPAHAQLILNLKQEPFAQALERLEEQFPGTEFPEVSAQISEWFALGLKWHWWTGIRD
jgi:hypothetical protein